MRHIYYIALDGAADRSIPELGNRTPLEAARTPHLDEMVRCGQMSQVCVLENGLTPESDSGAMALLGYAPERYYCGRGTLECMGLETYRNYRYFTGFRVNFASLSAEHGTLDRRTQRDITAQELAVFTDALVNNISLDKWEDIHFELRTFGNFRGILGLYSNTRKLSGNVCNTDPGFVRRGRFSVPVAEHACRILPCVPLDDTPEAALTAEIINDLTAQCAGILAALPLNEARVSQGRLPANCILIRDGGEPPEQMPAFREKYGKSLAVYGQLPCEKAVSGMIGGTFHYTQAFELQLEEGYLRRFAKTLKNEVADVVFCHLKGPDEPGHDHNPRNKVRAIELIDRCFFAELWEPGSDHIYIVSCDHATPCALGIHSDDPVPLLITGGGITPDETRHFDESNARRGACPVRRATEILDYIMKRHAYV